MSVFSRVALAALVCLSFVAGCVAQTASYTFCYKLTGLPASTLDDPYALAVLVSGTYNSTLQTSTAGKYTPAGQYYTLLTATGTRSIRTRNSLTVTQSILSLAPLNTLFSDNRFYISNATFPQFVDGDGLTFNVAANTPFPGKILAAQYNLYRTGVYGPVLEDKTTGIDLTMFSLSANIAGWTGTPYTAGSCVPGPLEANPTVPSTPAGVYRITMSYNVSSIAPEPAWNVVANAVFLSNGSVTVDTFGDAVLFLSTARLAVNGTRTYCIQGACSTSAIYAAANPGLYTFSDNRVYRYAPYIDYNGVGYLINPAQPKPGYLFTAPATNFTTTVNPYVSKAGDFFEGFGNGGTGPNGRVNTALTSFSFISVRVA